MTKTTRFKQALLAAALVLAATATVAETRRCFTAQVPGSIVLPDGSKHASGTLRICNERKISPVSTLNLTYTDGQPVGMYSSVPRAIEQVTEPGHAQFVFERNGDGELRLLGYVLGSRDETVFHEMSRGSLGWGENAGRTDRDNRVVIAAAAR